MAGSSELSVSFFSSPPPITIIFLKYSEHVWPIVVTFSQSEIGDLFWGRRIVSNFNPPVSTWHALSVLPNFTTWGFRRLQPWHLDAFLRLSHTPDQSLKTRSAHTKFCSHVGFVCRHVIWNLITPVSLIIIYQLFTSFEFQGVRLTAKKVIL